MNYCTRAGTQESWLNEDSFTQDCTVIYSDFKTVEEFLNLFTSKTTYQNRGYQRILRWLSPQNIRIGNLWYRC